MAAGPGVVGAADEGRAGAAAIGAGAAAAATAGAVEPSAAGISPPPPLPPQGPSPSGRHHGAAAATADAAGSTADQNAGSSSGKQVQYIAQMHRGKLKYIATPLHPVRTRTERRTPAARPPPSLGPKSKQRETEDEKIWRLFRETDKDGSGSLDMTEIKTLCKKLGDRMSQMAIEEAFQRMDPELTGLVNFEAFRRWRKLRMDLYRKELRRNVAIVFAMVDEDGNGTLDTQEMSQMMAKIQRKFKGVDFDPPFDLAVDFPAMDKHQNGEVTWEVRQYTRAHAHTQREIERARARERERERERERGARRSLVA
jgi:Ca2+-binding EF-hand superfamily protein